MLLHNLIIEAAIYNIQPVADRIWVDIVQPFLIKAKSDKTFKKQTIKINNYLDELIIIRRWQDYNLQIYLVLEVTYKATTQYEAKYIYPSHFEMKKMKKKDIEKTIKLAQEKGNIIHVHLRFKRSELKEKNIKQLKINNFKYLSHELVHSIDDAISDLKTGLSSKSEKAYLKSGDINYYTYFMFKENEFNALIHEIKIDITKNKKEWNKINNSEDIIKFILKKRELEYEFGKFTKEQQKNFIRKLFKRLARERMLPPRFIPRLDSKIKDYKEL